MKPSYILGIILLTMGAGAYPYCLLILSLYNGRGPSAGFMGIILLASYFITAFITGIIAIALMLTGM